MKCTVCRNVLSPRESLCPVCHANNGAPNVRRAADGGETAALEARIAVARDYCTANDLETELQLLESLAENSQAVMTRSYIDTAKLLESSRNIYVGFAIEVESGMRLPDSGSWDGVRQQWENAIFPTYSDKMLFASLSIGERGLRNYGGADIVLLELTLAPRASVFESNGLNFAARLKMKDRIPDGFRAKWQDRAKVVIAKLYRKLSGGITRHEIDEFLQVDAGGGADDDFVEVHIFGGVNRDAFDKILAKPRDTIEAQAWGLVILLAEQARITTVSRP